MTSNITKIQNTWLKLGITSLAFAGLYSVVLVVLRTPQLASFFPNPHIFKSALIIHVDLSVLIWLLSITASVWGSVIHMSSRGLTTGSSNKKYKYKKLRLSCFILDPVVKPRDDSVYPKLAFFATILIAISPIAGHNPIMNNYIPMLENIIFVLGLSLFGITLLLYAINILYFFNWANWSNLINFTILSTIIMYILSWVCFWCSYSDLQNVIQIIPIEIEFYYKLLFWSGGHLLQFIYTQIAMFIWIMLFEKLIGRESKFQKFYLFLLYLNFVFSTLIIWGHISYDIIDGNFKEFYTNHMKYLGGIAPGLCIGGIGLEWVCHSRKSGNPEKKIYWIPASAGMTASITKATLLCSITLFLLGGLIAMNISGINVVIPAHYHGSIVGISIACMGYCYLGVKRHCKERRALLHGSKNAFGVISWLDHGIQKINKNINIIDIFNWIPQSSCGMTITTTLYLLTFGQILHILGLAFAGGYGVMRKDPNTVMPLSAKLLMGMMGGGWLIAIVGGLMFVFICGKIIFLKNKQNYDD
ncbi:palindromic element RPE4 domain-containing protein [Rickettsia bellii]|uniref:palindromic element RPE4 domain-containing protein n=1 Tax=Rickettsia bellii TaxID=33990 RepID=UPI0002FA38A7|nr:palindromic element RPE4 domain-containing protein [Rickettsia bellii]